MKRQKIAFLIICCLFKNLSNEIDIAQQKKSTDHKWSTYNQALFWRKKTNARRAKNCLRHIFLNEIKFDEIMGTILWIKCFKRGWNNECAGAWETEDQLIALAVSMHNVFKNI